MCIFFEPILAKHGAKVKQNRAKTGRKRGVFGRFRAETGRFRAFSRQKPAHPGQKIAPSPASAPQFCIIPHRKSTVLLCYLPTKTGPPRAKNRLISQHGPTLLCNIASKKHGVFDRFPRQAPAHTRRKSPHSPAFLHAFVKFCIENVKNLYTKPAPHVL